jgi:glycosyltransferase involved in cell wall biosynthesis
LLAGRAEPSDYVRKLRLAGLFDRFTYCGSRTDMGFVHAAADLFVLPTKYEAFCLAIVEALASGLPVITTAVPGAADVISDGYNGRVQRDPNDSGELASLLRESLDLQQRSAWAAAARPSVAHLTWDQLLAQAEHLLTHRADVPRAVFR